MAQTTASSILIYGVSDSRKTTQIPEFARFVKEMTGRNTRLLSVETAGADRVEPAILAGLIKPFWLRQEPISALRHMQKGEWPRAVDANGNPTNDPSKATGIKWLPTPPEEWADIGGYAIEGTKTISNLALRTLADAGRGISRENLPSMVYEEDGIKIGSVAKNHYNDAQQSILKMITESPRGLFDASKGMVQYVLFTGHEAKGEDEGQAIYGVGTVGKATVKDIPAQVGTLLHHEIDRKTGKVYAYFQPHKDFQNEFIVWDAKANLPAHPAIWAKVEQKWPGGRFELRFDQTLYHYLKFQEEAKQYVAEVTKQLMAPKAATAVEEKSVG